jgi:hypothetical protein
MKIKLLIPVLLLSMWCFAQGPPTTQYTRISSSYNWYNGYFTGLTIPSGTTLGLHDKQWDGPGAIYFRTTDSSVHVWTGYTWRPIGSGASKGNNGVRLSGDTLQLGGKIDRYTYIEVPNREINGTTIGHILFGNNPEALSFNGVVSPWLTSDVYGASLVGVQKYYKESLGDSARRQYGAAFSTLSAHLFDSTSARYKAGVKNMRMPSQGIYSVYQVYPPRDSVVWEIGRDGESSEIGHFQFDLGNSYGYNIKTLSDNGSPEYPLNIVLSSMDYMRVIDNTRLHKVVGPGWSNITTRFKTYQTAITGSTYEAGNYVGQHTQATLYGDAYPDIGSATTKSKILNVFTLDTSIALKIRPLNLTTNTAKNGIAIWAQGTSDYSHFNGYVTIGGNLPTLQNGGQTFTDKVLVTGNVKATGNITAVGNTYAFVTQAYGMAVTIPIATGSEAGINFTQTDSVVTGTVAAYLSPSTRDGRGMYIRSEMFNAATYPDNSTGGFVQIETGANHANLTRWHRNGNLAVGYGANTLPYRLYKKLMVNGGSVFSLSGTDTMTIKYMPQGWVDTVRFKPVYRDQNNGDLYQAYNTSGVGGGGGSVTAVSAGFGHSFTTITGSGAVANDTTFASGNAVTSMLRYLKYSDSAKAVFTPMSRTLTAGYGLTGGGDLSANRSFLVDSTSGGLQTFLRGIKLVDSMVAVNNARYWNTGLITGVSGSQTGSRLGTNNSVPVRIFTNGVQVAYFDSTKAQLVIGTPTINNSDALIVRPNGATNYDGIRVFTSNLASSASYSSAGIQHAGSYDINLTSGGLSLSTVTGVIIGSSFATPTAWLQIKAGAAPAGQAAFKLTSGTDLTTPEAGAFYYNGTRLGFSPSTTIKRFAMTNDVAPSNGQIPIGNGTDYTVANITSGGTITVTNGSGTINLDIPTTILNAGSNLGLGSVTSGANLDNVSVVSGSYSFTRSYSLINFSVQFNVDPTASGTTTVFHFMPAITSNFSAATNAKGTITASGVTMSGEVTADATNDDMIATFISAGTSSVTITITGQYVIQ